MKNWNIEEMTGYHPITTFYQDFSIADAFGESAIRDTYNRSFNVWKNNYKYLTELVMVLNWKIWEHYLNKASYGNLYHKGIETHTNISFNRMKEITAQFPVYVSVGKDQCGGRGKAHLESGRHQRLGRDQQDYQRGQRHRPQRDRAAVGQHGCQHNGDHQPGALGRHAAARQPQIGGRRRQGG